MLSLVRHSVPPALFILLGLLFATSPALAQGTEGLFVTVSNPITSDTVERIQKQLNMRIHAESRRSRRSCSISIPTANRRPRPSRASVAT